MGVSEASAAYRLAGDAMPADDAVSQGYKRTEAGVIPEDWDVTTVGAEYSIQLGKMLDSEKNIGVSKPYLGNRAVQWGRIDVSDLTEIKLTQRDLGRYRLVSGDLLVCEGGDVGRAAVWNDQLDECYYQKALHRLRAKRGYSQRLLMYMLQELANTGQLQNFVTQTSIAHLPKDKFEAVPIPLPAASEQKAIAEALSDADALIESLQQLIAKKRAIKQGVMQALLIGRQRLPGFAKSWESHRLSEFGSVYGGLSGKTKPDFGHGSGLYVTFMGVMASVAVDMAALDSVDVKPSEDQNEVEKGDLLFNGSSETPEEIGLCAVIDEKVDGVYLNSFCFGYRAVPDAPVDPLYLAYFYRSGVGRDLLAPLAQGAIRYNLSKRALLELEFELPPKEEQTAIATVLSDMDAEIDALEARLAKTRDLKAGMMQALLTGRIRLPLDKAA